MRVRLFFLAMAIVTCLASCSDNSGQQARIAEPSATSEPPSSRAQIQLSVKTREELDAQIESCLGKVVVVDLWALW